MLVVCGVVGCGPEDVTGQAYDPDGVPGSSSGGGGDTGGDDRVPRRDVHLCDADDRDAHQL